MIFLRTQIRNCRIWSDWKYSGLLPLVVLTVSGSEEALWWLLSQLLRYSFCGICGNELEGLALVAQGQKSLFPRWPILHPLFCSHIYWCGDTQKDILVGVHPFMTNHFYCGQDCPQEGAQAHVKWMLPRGVLAWETFRETTLLHPGWHQRKGTN